jgi:uncharacterized protein DUF4190
MASTHPRAFGRGGKFAAPAPNAGSATTSAKASASLTLGIVGLLFLPVVLSTMAIVLGALALRETDRRPGVRGRGMAIAGLALGIVGLVAGIVMGVSAFA